MAEQNITNAAKNKYENLKKIIKECGKLAIAFSGGVDSTFLMKVAHDVLGENAVAVTISSLFVTDDELLGAKKFCEGEGVKHVIYKADVLSIPGIDVNPPDRCYICKKAIFTNVGKIVADMGINVVAEGTNVDDDSDYRPGMRAIKELGVRSPLKSHMLSLPTWNMPSAACLASRLAYGEKITGEKLNMVYEAEKYIRSLGFGQFRVRLQSGIARIELSPDDIDRFMDKDIRNAVSEKLHNIGFKYVSLDLDGYRTGSMNEVLK